MSFKSIRESYSGMIGALQNAGMKLSDTQRAKLDESVKELENSMNMQRQNAIRQTRRLTEARMEKEYRRLFESIMANQAKNAELATKIQEKVLKMNEAETLAGKVSDYLELYLESVLPRKTVVDYDRMQKLERLHESLKDMLGIDEFGMQDRMQKLEESKNEELEDVKKQLRESRMQIRNLNGKLRRSSRLIKEAKEEELDDVKECGGECKDCKKDEIFEREDEEPKDVKECGGECKGCKNDDEILEREDEEPKDVKECGDGCDCEDKKQTTLEAEIEDVLNDNEFNQCGMFKNQPHNGHSDDSVRRFDEKDEQPFETMESVKVGKDGDVELDESEVIDGDLMQFWCNQARVSD